MSPHRLEPHVGRRVRVDLDDGEVLTGVLERLDERLDQRDPEAPVLAVVALDSGLSTTLVEHVDVNRITRVQRLGGRR